ncbi:hypothetical protein VNO77_08423 [Canavalia gladiata]|uniref:Uncharacterized protein n=1 Tax=Canavalia gladiata TaxID=3824 RepID=A0AAN9MC80_CANGL
MELWSGENWPWPHSLSKAICYGLEWILIVNPHAVNSREKATRPIDAHHTETYSLRSVYLIPFLKTVFTSETKSYSMMDIDLCLWFIKKDRPSAAALYPVGDCRAPVAEFSAQIGLTTYFQPRGLTQSPAPLLNVVSSLLGLVLFRTVYMGAFLAISTYGIHLTKSLPMRSIKKSRGVLRLVARGLVARLGGSRLSGSLGRLMAYSVAWLFKNKSRIQGARTHTLEAMHMVSYYPTSLSIYQDRRLNGHLWEKAIGGVRTRLLYMAFERLSCLNQALGHVMICN